MILVVLFSSSVACHFKSAYFEPQNRLFLMLKPIVLLFQLTIRVQESLQNRLVVARI